ncbi:MAG: FtsQ-type POTRA domain-containing protein [Oscillospiraceae bacterium]|nr:FtsQ-type POTRA domain-containing protein [Oscillospiraceae bacterium]
MTKERRSTKRNTDAEKRRPVSSVPGKLAIMAAVVAAVVFSVAIFFKVGRIEVQGNSIYSADEIRAACTVQLGDNLLTVNKEAAAGSIMAELPYVERVSIGRVMPDTVVLQVSESTASFAVATDTNTVWLINTVGKALEKTDAVLTQNKTDDPFFPKQDENAPTVPQIRGLIIKNPTAGTTVTATDQSALNAALAVFEAFDGTGVIEHIVTLDVEKEFDIVIQYDDKYEILLGGTDNLEYKAQYLLAILDQLSAYQAGTIDLTFTERNTALFHPKA